MKFPHSRSLPPGPHRQNWPSPGPAALLLALLSGCASPRPPRPPTLNLPDVPRDLTAQRTGDQVLLRWTTPEKTTDRLEIKGPIVAELCRIQHPAPPPANQPPGNTAAPCIPVQRLAIGPGPSQAVETLPSPLTAGPPTLLAYRVQLLNDHSRSAGLSTPAFAAAGAAPPAVQQLHATTSPTGALLEWQPYKAAATETAAQVELDRSLIAPLPTRPAVTQPAPAASKPHARPTPAAPSKFNHTHPPAAVSPDAAPATPLDVKLLSPKRPTDPGGVVDRTAATGDTYRYTAQRVLSVSLDGHPLTLRSLPSAPVTLTLSDIFPPAVPTGLEAVPGGASPASPSIDLSWTPGTDTDLAGYLVYRQNLTSSGESAGPFTRLTAAPLPAPAYSDPTAVPGQRYAYHVTAVDTSGNESAPSLNVQETVRLPQ